MKFFEINTHSLTHRCVSPHSCTSNAACKEGELCKHYAADPGSLDTCQPEVVGAAASDLSSPKGLRAESARAFTGRRNSYSGRGQDFLSRQPNFFTETAVTPERKVEKWFPRWEINRHAEG